MSIISIEKDVLRKMIQEAVKKKLGTLKKGKVENASIFAGKLDALIAETIKKIDTLYQEGTDAMLENPTHDYAIQERNHSIIARMGILKSIKNQLFRVSEDLFTKI